jgi:uncharacterized protein YjbJ (UPF0337 family)
MTNLELEANWNQIKGGLRQRYAVLTDDDLNLVEGKGEEMLGRLQEKLGMGEEELHYVLHDIGADAFDDVRDKAGTYVDDAKAAVSLKAGEAVSAAKKRALTLHEDAEDYIRQQPRQSFFTALAAGFLLALLLRR